MFWNKQRIKKVYHQIWASLTVVGLISKTAYTEQADFLWKNGWMFKSQTLIPYLQPALFINKHKMSF